MRVELTIGGERFRILDRGLGPPVLLVHGFPLDHAMWAAQVDALAQRHRVLAPDLRGFGGSAVTEGCVTMGHMADDLAALLDELDVRERLVYVGFSMGGYVGWPFAARHGRRLRGLVAVDTRAVADTPAAAAARRAMAERLEREGPAVAADAMQPRLLAPDRPARDPELARAVREMMLRQNPRGIAAAQRGMAARADARAWLARLAVPLLAICGEHDAISTRDEMQALADTAPDGRLVEVRDAGHLAPMESPAAVSSALLDFLARLG